MKSISTVEIEKCFLCGKEGDTIQMRKRFVGGTQSKYICPECQRRGDMQVNGKHKEWRSSARGKQIIEMLNKRK